MLSQYKAILVIGNGFDLNVGLKASYADFRKHLKLPNFLSSYLYRFLFNRNIGGNWINIEDQLRYYSTSFIKSAEDSSSRLLPAITKYYAGLKFRAKYIKLCSDLKSYLLEVQKEKLEVKSQAIEVFRKLEDKFHDLYIINFNYTNTIERIGFTHKDSIVHHIHGSLDSDGFVFGIEDSGDICRNHSFLFKSYNPFLNVAHLNERFDDAEDITFFGYSLGQTDHSYFDDFFRQQSSAGCKRKNFTFYHYGQEAYDDLYWQLRTLTDKRIAKFKQFNNVSFKNVKS